MLRLLSCACALLLPAPLARAQFTADWLVSTIATEPSFTPNSDGTWTLSNGLVSRTFTFTPAFGTVDVFSLTRGASLIRAIDSEGYIGLDNVTYALGGLVQSGVYYHAWLNRSQMGIQVNTDGWNATSWSLSTPEAIIEWTPGTRGSPATANWPPRGLTLSVTLAAPASAPPAHRALSVTLHYELITGKPFLTKWMSVNSTAAAAAGVVITSAVPETLRLAMPYSPLAFSPSPPSTLQAEVTSYLYVTTDEPHGTLVNWVDDTADPADPGAEEPQLSTSYSSGPGVVLSGGDAHAFSAINAHYRVRYHPTRVGGGVAEFVSFRTFLVVTDSSDPERFGLSVRALYRTWAPWIMENPIFFHATETSEAGFQLEVEQMAEVGFEMLIYSFGTNFDLESQDPAYIASVAAQIAYARSKGIEVGGYDLICLDRGEGGYGGNVGVQWDTVLADGSLGPDACFASGWVDKLKGLANSFFDVNMTMLESDGPYAGNECGSTNHSSHIQLSDSVYQQTRTQALWYAGLRARNIYINQPDNYAFFGGQRTGEGYDEDQYNLPPWEDVTVSRMTVYENTFRKVPSYGWMFVPLVPYHGGPDSQFEPMSEHLPQYNMALAQYLLAGVAACYRGFRLYDTPEVQAVVAKWVAIYKQYRDIINADIIHIRRPDGQSIDAFMHASAALPQHKGFLAAFNPTSTPLTQTLSVPLYYTGITTTARILAEGQQPTNYTLARDYSVLLSVTIPAQSVTWFAIEDADSAAPAELRLL